MLSDTLLHEKFILVISEDIETMYFEKIWRSEDIDKVLILSQNDDFIPENVFKLKKFITISNNFRMLIHTIKTIDTTHQGNYYINF